MEEVKAKAEGKIAPIYVTEVVVTLLVRRGELNAKDLMILACVNREFREIFSAGVIWRALSGKLGHSTSEVTDHVNFKYEFLNAFYIQPSLNQFKTELATYLQDNHPYQNCINRANTYFQCAKCCSGVCVCGSVLLESMSIEGALIKNNFFCHCCCCEPGGCCTGTVRPCCIDSVMQTLYPFCFGEPCGKMTGIAHGITWGVPITCFVSGVVSYAVSKTTQAIGNRILESSAAVINLREKINFGQGLIDKYGIFSVLEPKRVLMEGQDQDVTEVPNVVQMDDDEGSYLLHEYYNR
ncbi:MAG: hypothetical protein SFW07_03710 [Gammaproteobacteria bacterium]|nr:hypothetical protein [Gammaproteobacteria bacterium]